MSQSSEQYDLLKAIINKELNEINEEMATQDNSDISSVIAFHIEHGIRDIEARIADNELTELEVPFGTSNKLKESMNPILLTLEAELQYYYRACYFGTEKEQKTVRNKILNMLDHELI